MVHGMHSAVEAGAWVMLLLLLMLLLPHLPTAARRRPLQDHRLPIAYQG